MGFFGALDKAFDWINKFIDWFGKKKKGDYERKVDKAVDSHDERAITDIVHKVTRKRNKRRNRS